MSTAPAGTNRFGTQGRGVAADDRFPDPFMDMASTAMPLTNSDALQWCEFIISANGVYREAISRVISYFITDVEITDLSDRRVGQEERDKFKNFLEDTLGIKSALRTVALDYMCFHGDTPVPTRNGVYKIRDLAGQTVDVISQDGVYRPATFKQFGQQSLLEVTFSDGRQVLATPEHQWIVQKSNGGHTKVPTTALAGRRIERTVAPRPEKNAEFDEGVRHGFTFGDGSLYNKQCPTRTPKAVANFFGAKDQALLPYFEGHGTKPRKQTTSQERYTVDRYKIHGLPSHYKSLPANDASDSYWYGFVCGFLAADGSVDTYGCAVLTQKAAATLAAIEAQLPRIGMVAGPLRSQSQTMLLPEYKGQRAEHSLTMHYMTLLKQFMQPDDFIIPHHRENFERNWDGTRYGKYVGVKSVEPTAIIADVYCCVEPETHSFVIANGIITGNCYGNSFTTMLMPFRRYLACKGCHFEAPLKKIYNTPAFNFKWQNFEFTASCPKCGYHGKWRHIDRRSGESGQIKIKRWNPHEIDLLYDPYTENVAYIWKIPEEYRNQIRQGKLHHLEGASWEIIQAVKDNQNLLFDKDVVYHMKEEALAGIYNRGWGVSRVLSNFRQAWYVQVLHRYNEAIALDYVVPFRVLTPETRAGAPGGGGAGGGGVGTDPVHSINMGGFSARVKALLRQRRRDPAAWNVLPFGLEYKALGGDAKTLAPTELLDQGLDTLLTAIGVPVEFYKGSLSVQAAPAALRLFEANWSHLVHGLNRLLVHLVTTVSRMLSWEPVGAALQKVTHADDLNRQMAKLQLMMGKQVSQTSGLKSVGLDYKEEIRQQLAEERLLAEEQQAAQKEMEQAAQMDEMASPSQMVQGAGNPGASATGMPQGGAPPQAPPGGAAPPAAPPPGQGGMMGAPSAVDSFIAARINSPNVPRTPEDLNAQAQIIANQLMAMPDSQKDSELIKLKRSDATMHALVTSVIDDIRQSAKQQGGQMVLAQQYGKQADYGKELRGLMLEPVNHVPVDVPYGKELRRLSARQLFAGCSQV